MCGVSWPRSAVTSRASAQTAFCWLLAVLSLLQTRRDWPGEDLAERLDTTTRAVYRDAGRLRALDYPILTVREPASGYCLQPGTQLPPLLFDDGQVAPQTAAVGTTALQTAAAGTTAPEGAAYAFIGSSLAFPRPVFPLPGTSGWNGSPWDFPRASHHAVTDIDGAPTCSDGGCRRIRWCSSC
ncbi:helix-turn-helix transcriptional regulator [Streptomyces sp. NPDC056161]|uniref:helix-turn-helix transcriptional regulator n=1 Tax=Streptomyces sp. NPDC056161 TaxID=3345732 RepID=UPI0035D7F2D7